MAMGGGETWVLPGIEQANGILLYQRNTEVEEAQCCISPPGNLERGGQERYRRVDCFFFFFSRKAHCREMKEGQRGPLYLIIGFKVIRSTQSRCNSKALSPIAFVFI